MHKLILDDDLEEDFSLIAIHCSEEDYKLAYLLNNFANIQLSRCENDVIFSKNEGDCCFPLFYFKDVFLQLTYYLVANKSKIQSTRQDSISTLFSDSITSETINTQLIPEFKNVDYFLKIQCDAQAVPVKKIITQINEIKQVISAYEVTQDRLKSKHNLIFD